MWVITRIFVLKELRIFTFPVLTPCSKVSIESPGSDACAERNWCGRQSQDSSVVWKRSGSNERWPIMSRHWPITVRILSPRPTPTRFTASSGKQNGEGSDLLCGSHAAIRLRADGASSGYRSLAQCLFGKRRLAQRHYRTHHECQALANAFSHHGLVCQGGMQSPESLLGIGSPSYYPGQKQDHWTRRGKADVEQDG